MKIFGLTLASALCLSSLAVLNSSAMISIKDKNQFAKWAAIKSIYPAAAEPIGGYDAGCLAGAIKLDSDAPGYAIMRPSRNRYFSHPELNIYLHALSEKLQSFKMPLLLIGDAGPPRGGPMLSGHASHQIGLDVDLWLTMGSSRPTHSQRESWGAPSFVIKRKKLKKTWSQTQAALVSTAANFDVVNRIFVSPAIKKYFCANFAGEPWLYKLRAWWGHEEHIHVRLNCPAGSAACMSQPPLDPADSDCGSNLDWWFSKEADDEWAKMVSQPSERLFPNLPSACDKMVAP
ncbi:MAG: penicillin-insensitive murein endopeptidase [Bdellovibrionales bacterium]